MFAKFFDWYENRHDYARDWLAKNDGEVVGCFCSYAPEELIYAAGLLPVRVLGSHEPQDVTEPHIFGMFCPFCRDVLAQGLKGRYDYMKGITLAQSCLHLRQSYTSWKNHVPVDYSFYLYMPNKVQTDHAYSYYSEELVKFRKSLEKWTGRKITDESLRETAELYNENRRLMREVYDLRKQSNPPLTGLDAMVMVASSFFVDKKEHNAELTRILPDLKSRKLDRETGVRLMIVGSEDDDTEFVKMVESVGSTIVVDDHCTGSRYFWNLTEFTGNVLPDIATRYINRPPCPTKDWEERTRLPHILNLAKEFKVDGIILIQQKFCDPHEADMVPLKDYLNSNGYPTLFLEFDVTVPVGQMRIRVEAFLEMLGVEELF
ncbi:MAG: benzoyl-CoA reductase, bzd-type, subunit N [candidate division Zixibacteria bacterium]|nr:benzoyl-CoA reductase, bzd-type, subunit N [candidate division Zixibacteria bacterium]MBU1470063.1 benzoyl-CoA reductase, bzd-type, subunit N [candidate division Zixibacteria bacterium]MBU2624383.1 benzoyl-CoA reductase, bzd-type, subunit N [candidate division Zixibacteria bacterium]